MSVATQLSPRASRERLLLRLEAEKIRERLQDLETVSDDRILPSSKAKGRGRGLHMSKPHSMASTEPAAGTSSLNGQVGGQFETSSALANKIYAVAVGRTAGIYDSWAAAQPQVDSYSGAVYKSFKELAEAEAFLVGFEAGFEAGNRRGYDAGFELATDEFRLFHSL